jgi:predicted GNAT family N-acyltransferase
VQNSLAFRIATTSYKQHQSGIQDIRRRVFIEEQGIDPALEWDEHDANAIFAVAMDAQNHVIGTARLLNSGKIGRMAVLREYRRQGVGTALLLHLLMLARQRGYERIELSAQQSVMEFYLKQGFEPVGPPHVEVGIPHQNMQCVF